MKPYDHPFEILGNVVLSSHKAMQTASGHARYVADTLENVLQYLSDGALKNAVNLKKGIDLANNRKKRKNLPQQVLFVVYTLFPDFSLG